MPKVELIYDGDCPNADRARRVLAEAFARIGDAPNWVEWDRGLPESPSYSRLYGSPTILVDGKDVVGAETGAEHLKSCRVYADDRGGFTGTPPVESVVRALQSRKG